MQGWRVRHLGLCGRRTFRLMVSTAAVQNQTYGEEMTAPLTAQCADCKHRDDPEYGCKLSSLRNCVRYEKEEKK